MTVALTIDDPFQVTNAILWPLVFVKLQLNYSNYSCILTTEVFFLILDKYNCIISLESFTSRNVIFQLFLVPS